MKNPEVPGIKASEWGAKMLRNFGVGLRGESLRLRGLVLRFLKMVRTIVCEGNDFLGNTDFCA